jgi:hypothetical protein
VSLMTTLAEAGCTVTELAGQAAQVDAVGPVAAVSEVGVERVVADKGYHSKQALQDLAEVGVRTVIAEPERKRQQWTGQSAAQAAVYANRRRLNTKTAKALMRRRGELIERSFAHLYDTGGMRRVHLRRRNNIAKRALIHAAAFNLSLILRQMLRVGTARQAADLWAALCFAFLRVTQAAQMVYLVIGAPRPIAPPLGNAKSMPAVARPKRDIIDGLLVLLGHKRTLSCRIVLWDHASPRQAHKRNASRHI